MKTSKIVFGLLAGLIGCTAFAQENGVSETGIRYNEIYAGYQTLSNSSIRMNGYTIGGSALIDKNILVDAVYADVSKSTVKSQNTTVGIGYRLGVAQNTDVYAKLGYINVGGVTSDSSYLLTGGARGMLTPDVELTGQVTYSGLKNASLYYGVGLGYYLADNLTIRGQVRADNATKSNTTYVLTVGYNF